MAGSDLYTGTLNLLILRTLSAGDQHGYGVGQALKRTSNGVLDVAEGVLYPALHRLEEKGLLEAYWAKSETGRRAKFYRLTRRGHTELDRSAEGWERITQAVRSVLSQPDPDRS